MAKTKGRVTLPNESNFLKETKEYYLVGVQMLFVIAMEQNLVMILKS